MDGQKATPSSHSNSFPGCCLSRPTREVAVSPPPRPGRGKALIRPGPCPPLAPAVVSGPRRGSPQWKEAGTLQGLYLWVIKPSPASSPQDSRLYLVFPHDSSALSNSFHHLQLFDQDSSNVVSVSPQQRPSGCARRGACGGRGGRAECDQPSVCPQRFLQDPYSTTFNSFSRVTNFFRGALQPHPEGASRDLHPVPDDEPEPGFEVISCVSSRADPITWGCHAGVGPHFPAPPFRPRTRGHNNSTTLIGWRA